jgi:type I restriction enzyme M protein
VKTSILILDKAVARKSDSIAFFKVENDGYGLGAQRRAFDKNDLPQVKAELAAYLQALRSGQAVDALQPTCGLIVAKEKIAENGDYNLSGERYREGAASLSEYHHVRLDEVCEINPDNANPIELYPNSHFNYIDISCVENESGKFLGPNKTDTDEAPSRARRSVRQGDVLMSTVRPNLKAFALLTEIPERAIASTGFAVLRAKPERLLPGFLINVLRDERSVDQMIGMAGKGAYPSINQTDVESIQIPLPPLEVQKEIVAEIEGYQKVINGARAVLDHYRPQIPIRPDWPIVRLADVCETITDGDHQPPPKASEGVPFVTITNINDDHQLDFTKTFFVSEFYYANLSATRRPQGGDVLYTVTGSYGIPVLVPANVKFCFQRHIALIRTGEQLLSTFLHSLLASPFMLQQGHAAATGVAQKTVSLNSLRNFSIPLPPLATQQAIVAEIEAEKALVAANRELIARFEKKIQATLARVWGEG